MKVYQQNDKINLKERVVIALGRVFEATDDDVVLNIRDISHREHKLIFKKGGRIEYMRSVGKYRLRWNDNDLTN